MKKTIVALLAVMAGFAPSANAQFIDLVSFGTSGFTLDTTISSGSYSAGATGVTYSPSVVLGDSFGGTFNAAPLDWSSNTSLATDIFLKLSITGVNPNAPMTLEIFDSTFASSVKYQGTTDPSASGTSAPYFKFTLSGAFTPAVMASVGGAQITWDGDATINANIQAIATVPEPSTYALLALSGLALSGYVIRRRHRA